MFDPNESAGAETTGPLRALAVYLLAVFCGGAAIAPWLWQSAQWLAREHAIGTGLAAQPFHRYVHRCLLGLALALLWPLVRAFRLQGWSAIGWHWNATEGRRWLGAFLLGFAVLGAAMGAGLAGGGRLWNTSGSAGQWAGKLGGAAVAAVAVSVIEEVLFRGAVFSALRRNGRFVPAALVTSVAYAWVHFFERTASPAVVDGWSGFRTLGGMLHGFVDPQALVPGLASLFVAGWTLAILRERTGGLGASMGLHAGWIFWLRAHGWVTVDAPGADPRWWGSAKLYDGWVAFALLAGLAIWIHVRAHPNDHDSTPASPDR